MLFNSYLFLFWFLPVVLLGYYGLPAARRIPFLTVMSFVFYGWWNVKFLGLLWLSILVDYTVGWWLFRLSDPRARRWLATLSVTVSLSLLGFVKYFLLIAETANHLSGRSLLPIWRITLPVGISFYTFQSMSYVLDIYRRRCEPARNLLEFAWYVSFFPQLVAGPIVRYTDLAGQLRHRDHTADKAARGCLLIVMGLMKKVLVADSMARIADPAFAGSTPSALGCWVAILAYSAQIYFDFSGYSDIAVGLGLLFGFEFMQNFNVPYQAKSFKEFWTRWHISLSTWLRDYLYIPLGGNRLGAVRGYVNCMIVMLLGGLWHGANWTFVVWGGYHGVLLVAERMLGDANPLRRLPGVLQRVSCQFFIVVGWVFFRSQSLPQALQWLGAMFGVQRPSVIAMPAAWLLWLLATVVLITQVGKEAGEIRWRYNAWGAVAAAGGFVWCVVALLNQGYAQRPFLYFQF